MNQIRGLGRKCDDTFNQKTAKRKYADETYVSLSHRFFRQKITYWLFDSYMNNGDSVSFDSRLCYAVICEPSLGKTSVFDDIRGTPSVRSLIQTDNRLCVMVQRMPA